ncbi:MAG: hypothetical protein KME01_01525 [Chroococcus sp. CMT-3BRIN-NPC107]|nr:hypothetical protein [Chroococcus sp. CMT-3BRIN-NPC107]
MLSLIQFLVASGTNLSSRPIGVNYFEALMARAPSFKEVCQYICAIAR